jgi:16S rRNA (cytosine967-C5)-methyltransferase
MPVSPSRAIAFEILERVEVGGAYAADALHARLSTRKARREDGGASGAVKRQDAALATELVFGVLRWQRLLDFLIERQARRPAAGLDADVRRALRLGAYQLLFLDRVPPSAAVNESVELTKRAGKPQAAALVNAVLRRLPQGPFRADAVGRLLPIRLAEAERLGILYSHPTWMVARWLATFGPERTRALMEADNRPLPVACSVLDAAGRAQVAETLREDGLDVEPGKLLRNALLVRGGNVAETTAFHEGWIVVQDEASQAVAMLAGVKKGHSVLDLCAAPGNKTLHLARAAGAQARVVAADLHPHRLRAVRAQLERTGTADVGLVALDATRALPLARQFDRILVDAPCSGTGTLARNPEIRWRLKAEDVEDLVRRQEAILRQALEALAPGGRLVYATCSLEPEENEGVVRRVAGERKDIRVGRAPEGFGEQLAPGVETERLFDAEGFFRTLPQETTTDGFFAAVLERE